ncbi:MAG: hypothetical protein ACNS62_14490 [Candidatus Cyclobacteriaceae bacterium M3_2C_046]
MRILGYILIGLSFLVCSFLTVLNEFSINWLYFIPTLSVGVIGVAIARISTRKEATSEHVMTKNIDSLHTSLDHIVTNIRQLNQEKNQINVYELPKRIDETFLDDLNIFVAARESIGHAYTLQDYADIMSHYAAGERYLNRVWSASADGYIDESKTYLEKAQAQFEQAHQRLKALSETGKTTDTSLR